ncbi:Dehydrogenase/reductase SDR family protein 7-like [Cryptotermes secundus]|uniref:Dehydrogenase/reductase SDR family protein 7-like n=1 Tax=Cryptotermes secundus TaxID=105785 RepID=A0A2J7R2Y6_9NEOP|nr:Dehydrogenase/reductase SDR family protein 7-like [Cryptotermes secundus]
MGETRNFYRILVGKPEGKRPQGRPRHRWVDNIRMDLRVIGWDVVDWIDLTRDRDQWRALVYTAVPTHLPVVLPLDLSDLNSLPDCVTQALAIFGHVDILIHNGGISNRGDVISTDVDVAMKIMMVNYFGQMVLTKAVLPSMIERRSGHIVTVSSIQGRIAIPYRSAYAASKHALQAFSDSLRAELARYNIKVSVISPGYIATALSVNALTGSGEAYGETDSATANGYTPEYVAEKILSAVVQCKEEMIISPVVPRLAMLIRTLAPSLYFWIMERRARNTSG